MKYRCLIPDRFIDINAKSEEEAYDLAKKEFIRRFENDEVEVVVWEWGTEQRKHSNSESKEMK